MKILDRIQFAKDLDFLQLLRVLTIFPQFNSACITITYPFKDDRLLYKKICYRFVNIALILLEGCILKWDLSIVILRKKLSQKGETMHWVIEKCALACLCLFPEPDWAAINFGITLCKFCAGRLAVIWQKF